MAVSQKTRIGNTGIYTIRDTTAILWTMLFLLIFATLTFFVYRGLFNRSLSLTEIELWWWIIFFILPNVLLVSSSFRLKAIWDGVKLDLAKRTIEFGGGGVEANEISDYISPQYLLQYFIRYRINLDEISQLMLDQKTKMHYNKVTASWDSSIKYYIKLTGTFGAASVPFNSEGKCRELYTAIRQLNEMGDPIFMATG